MALHQWIQRGLKPSLFWGVPQITARSVPALSAVSTAAFRPFSMGGDRRDNRRMHEDQNTEDQRTKLPSVELISLRRVATATKGGTRDNSGFSAFVVAGDENGTGGHGLGKAKEPREAIEKAVANVKKNLVHVNRDGMRGLFHTKVAYFKKSKVVMMPSRDTNLIRSSANIWKVCKVLGVTGVNAKSHGSRNPLNVVRAAFKALADIENPQEVAERRGLKHHIPSRRK